MREQKVGLSKKGNKKPMAMAQLKTLRGCPKTYF
jgi:hypothetical protein